MITAATGAPSTPLLATGVTIPIVGASDVMRFIVGAVIDILFPEF